MTDNDGTLWAEQPRLFPARVHAIDRVKALAPEHPEWKGQEPFASVLEGDLAGDAGRARASTGRCAKLLGRHARGMTTEAYAERGQRLDRDGQASEDRPALHGNGLPADARSHAGPWARTASRPTSSPAGGQGIRTRFR